MTGRPLKLDDTLGTKLCQAAELGVPRRAQCRMVGIGFRTLYRWLGQGSEGVQPYATFRQRYLDAELRAEMGAVGVVVSAMRQHKKDPMGAARVAMEWLGRTRSRDYGKRVRVSHELEVPPEVAEEIVRVMVDIIQRHVTDPEVQVLIARELEVAFGGPDDDAPPRDFDGPPALPLGPAPQGNGSPGGNGSAS